MEYLPDLDVSDYYRMSREGLPYLQDLLWRLHQALKTPESVREALCARGANYLQEALVETERYQDDPVALSAMGSAAAIMLVPEDQLFDASVHRQFDGHDTLNVIQGVFGPHMYLARDSEIVKEILGFYKSLHDYAERLETRSREGG